MKFRPLHDRVVVKRIDADPESAGGIIIPDTAQEKPSQGEILSLSPGGRNKAGELVPIDLKVGDRVSFWQMVQKKNGGQARQHRLLDHEGKQHHRHAARDIG